MCEPATPAELLFYKIVIDGLLQASRSTEVEGAMSGMAIKFTSLAQIEANQFVSADDSLYLQKAEDFGAGVAAHAAMVENRSAGGLSLRQTRTGRGEHYRIYQLDTADHILAGHSIVCRSDAEAMDAACRFAEQAIAIEVWESARRVGRLSAAEAIHHGRVTATPRQRSVRAAYQRDQEAVARESRAWELALASCPAEVCFDPVTDPATARRGELAVRSACHQNDAANRGVSS
jgi:hypothetical protein